MAAVDSATGHQAVPGVDVLLLFAQAGDAQAACYRLF